MKDEQKPFEDKLKINFWVYIVVYLLLTIFILFLINLLFPLSDSEEDINWQTYVAMLIAFIPVYLLYSKVEKGKANFSNSLRWIVKIIIPCLAVNLIPTFLFVGLLMFGLKNIIIVYVTGIVLAILLVTVLSWLNNTSP